MIQEESDSIVPEMVKNSKIVHERFIEKGLHDAKKSLGIFYPPQKFDSWREFHDP